MKKTIAFFNRTYAQIIEAYNKLKTRYKRKVSFKFDLNNSKLYNGYFCVR